MKKKKRGGRSSEMLPSFMADAEEIVSFQDSEDQNSMFENFNKMVAHDKSIIESKTIITNPPIRLDNKNMSITHKIALSNKNEN